MKSQLSFAFCNEDLHGDWDEYLFLISPNRRIAERVIKVKEDACKICFENGVYSPPHITVAKLIVRRGSEAKVIALLQTICNKHRKFKLELEDFGSFEHRSAACTIYIKVKEHQPFLELANDLKLAKEDFKRIGCQIKCLVNNPHLSVVRRLPYLNYKMAMPGYRDKIFRDAFIVEDIVLSKRRTIRDKFHRVTIPLSPFNSSFN